MREGTERRGWSRDELLVAFRLYCRTPFGRLHSKNPEIVELGKALGRTPGAVAMKACNFASLDPAQQARGISGLSGASAADRAIWEEFRVNSEMVAGAAEEAYGRVMGGEALRPEIPDLESGIVIPEGPTEVWRTARARRVQGFFAAAVLASYGYRCALTGLGVKELLNASHIVPWSVDEKRRAHPSNGIALNALYDRAFDRGLIAFDDELRVIVSPRLKCEPMDGYQQEMVEKVEGRQLRMPVRFRPDMEAVRWHRERFAAG